MPSQRLPTGSIFGGSDHFDLQDRSRLDRVVLLRRDDREEVPDAHDLHARDVLDRVGVDGERHRVRAVAVGTLPARPNHAAVEHSGHADVGRVGVHARDDLGDVVVGHAGDPDLLVLARVLRRRDTGVQRRRRERDLHQLVADELAVGDGLAAAGDDALVHREARRRHAEARRRHAKQRLLRLGRRPPDQRAALRDRRRATGVAGVRGRMRPAGVELDMAELAEVHVELFGCDQHQAGRRLLTEVDAARVERHGVVRVDREERVDGIRVGRPGARERVDPRRCARGSGLPDEADPDDQRTSAFQEALARELLLGNEARHHAPAFAITAAAFWIAVRILG